MRGPLDELHYVYTQVRIIDLNRQAAKTFISHRSRVKTLEIIDSNCIISGGEGVWMVLATMSLFGYRAAE